MLPIMPPQGVLMIQVRNLTGVGKKDFRRSLALNLFPSERRLRKEGGFMRGAESKHLLDPQRYRFFSILPGRLSGAAREG
jgi:hypothetical protein